LFQLPVNPSEAMQIAGSVNRLKAFDFSLSLTQPYTFWSGLIAGTFLFMSYFGTDQSQAQRYLTARSVPEARRSLLMSAYWKIPLQALVLLLGVLVFVFYVFQTPPLLYNSAHEKKVLEGDRAAYETLSTQYNAALAAREQAARAVAETSDAASREAFKAAEQQVTGVRTEALALAGRVTGENPRDVNYIIPRYILEHLPIGLAGIFIAAVMAAAMSSIAAELNSLSTATVIDFYRRWYKPVATDAHYLFVSKASTLVWGVFACIIATYAATGGSLIEVVNRYGSFFYGSILGVFLLAMIPGARPIGAFVGLIAGMSAVAAVSFGMPSVFFLWHNVVGAVTVVVVGMLLSLVAGKPRPAA
jgi:Na+/proline symporter